MKYFSMFSGVGGFELGIQQAYEDLQDREYLQKQRTSRSSSSSQGNKSNLGIREKRRNSEYADCIGYSEIDKYATKIYQKHFPTHRNYGDATKINAAELPDFDFLVGGFPCQAFSIAGKRKGFNDTRGTLFFDIARILKEKRPRMFLLENVKGLLSHDNGRTFKIIISTLVELGYGIQWQVLNSKNHGVPQNRERVFIAGCLGGWGGRKVFPIGEGDEKNVGYGAFAHTINSSDWRGANRNQKQTLIQLKGGSMAERIYDKMGISTSIRAEGGGHGAKTGLYAVLTPDRVKKRQNGRRMKEDGEPMFTLTGQDIHGVMQGMRIRRLTPTECERLQGFPDGWTEGVSDTQRYKCLGNAVTVNVVKEIIKNINFLPAS
jgi:DNA (cytosine-5)-methyltransferase 1